MENWRRKVREWAMSMAEASKHFATARSLCMYVCMKAYFRFLNVKSLDTGNEDCCTGVTCYLGYAMAFYHSSGHRAQMMCWRWSGVG